MRVYCVLTGRSVLSVRTWGGKLKKADKQLSQHVIYARSKLRFIYYNLDWYCFISSISACDSSVELRTWSSTWLGEKSKVQESIYINTEITIRMWLLLEIVFVTPNGRFTRTTRHDTSACSQHDKIFPPFFKINVITFFLNIFLIASRQENILYTCAFLNWSVSVHCQQIRYNSLVIEIDS